MKLPSNGAEGAVAERGTYHPFRWRELTWFIVYVDAFGVAFFVGLLIGYRLVSPLGSDAEEGVAMLLFFTAALVLLFNVALGVIWIVSGIIARRRLSTVNPSVDGSGCPLRSRWLPARFSAFSSSGARTQTSGSLTRRPYACGRSCPATRVSSAAMAARS